MFYHVKIIAKADTFPASAMIIKILIWFVFAWTHSLVGYKSWFTCWQASHLSFHGCGPKVTSQKPTVFITGEGWWESDTSFLLYLTFLMKPQEVPSLRLWWLLGVVPTCAESCRAFSACEVSLYCYVIVLISRFLARKQPATIPPRSLHQHYWVAPICKVICKTLNCKLIFWTQVNKSLVIFYCNNYQNSTH